MRAAEFGYHIQNIDFSDVDFKDLCWSIWDVWHDIENSPYSHIENDKEVCIHLKRALLLMVGYELDDTVLNIDD